MNTSWLFSMETLAINFADEFGIQVNYARYRLVQVFAIYAALIVGKEGAKEAATQLWKKLQIGEWLHFGLLLSIITWIAPKRYCAYLSTRMHIISGSHPGTLMPTIDGEFNTILDVFGQVDPKNCMEKDT